MSSVRNTTGWEHFSHGSDIGVPGFGSSVEEAFEQAAVALTTVVADVSKIEESESVEVRRYCYRARTAASTCFASAA